MIKTSREDKQIAEQNKNYHEGVPAITVVVDGDWSKRLHKHSYNANSSVGIIFVATTKSYCILVSETNTVPSAPLHKNTVHHHHNPCASKIVATPQLQ